MYVVVTRVFDSGNASAAKMEDVTADIYTASALTMIVTAFQQMPLTGSSITTQDFRADVFL